MHGHARHRLIAHGMIGAIGVIATSVEASAIAQEQCSHQDMMEVNCAMLQPRRKWEHVLASATVNISALGVIGESGLNARRLAASAVSAHVQDH